jgi:hypothetical protein
VFNPDASGHLEKPCTTLQEIGRIFQAILGIKLLHYKERKKEKG